MNAFSRDNPAKLTVNDQHYCSQSAHQFHYMIVESSPELWIKLQPHITGRGDHITASNTIIGIEDILACQKIDAVLIRIEQTESLLSASLNLMQNYPSLPVIFFSSAWPKDSLTDDAQDSQHQINMHNPLSHIIKRIDAIVHENQQRLALSNKHNTWLFCPNSNRLFDQREHPIQLTANEGRFVKVLIEYSAHQVIARHAFAVALKKEHAEGIDKLLNVIASRIRNKVHQQSTQPFELMLLRGSGVKFDGEIHLFSQSDC